MEREEITGDDAEGAGSEGQAVRGRWKIRKIVVRCEPRTLAVGQPAPTISKYTSTVEVPGSSLSYSSVCPSSRV